MSWKPIVNGIGLKGHYWYWGWRWGTIYGYTDDSYTIVSMRISYYGPLVLFEM